MRFLVTLIGYLVLMSGVRAEQQKLVLPAPKASFVEKFITDDALKGDISDYTLDMLKLTTIQQQHVRDIISKEDMNILSPDPDEIEFLHQEVTAKTFDKAKVKAFLEKRIQSQIAQQLELNELKHKLYSLLDNTQKELIDKQFKQKLLLAKAFYPQG